VEYILSLFADARQAERAVETLRQAGFSEVEYEIKTHTEYTRTLKGWLERLFAMPEPLSGMEAEGVPHDDARWYEDQIKNGDTLLVVRAGQKPSEITTILERAGAHHIRRSPQRDRAWTHLSGKKP
jgi:hypothetical protein